MLGLTTAAGCWWNPLMSTLSLLYVILYIATFGPAGYEPGRTRTGFLSIYVNLVFQYLVFWLRPTYTAARSSRLVLDAYRFLVSR